ncbi:MAG TPA: hypothetical protein VN256_13030 [Pyrinomonadaceae bacterium]|nr:hypothetical protein [Pyrinomonadaceae bacterium]
MITEKELIEKARASDVPVCSFCGEPKSKNPHPNAGKPDAICHVGTVWECIPCLTLNRHTWARRAWKAEARLSIFDKFIHTNECSDEGGWFAYFMPDGETTPDSFELRVSGYDTEEEAVQALIKKAFEKLSA